MNFSKIILTGMTIAGLTQGCALNDGITATYTAENNETNYVGNAIAKLAAKTHLGTLTKQELTEDAHLQNCSVSTKIAYGNTFDSGSDPVEAIISCMNSNNSQLQATFTVTLPKDTIGEYAIHKEKTFITPGTQIEVELEKKSDTAQVLFAGVESQMDQEIDNPLSFIHQVHDLL